MVGIALFVFVILLSFVVVRGFAHSVFRSSVESLAVSIPFGIASFALLVSAGLVVTSTVSAMVFAVLALALLAGVGYFRSNERGVKFFWTSFSDNKTDWWWYGLTTSLLGVFLSVLVLGTLHGQTDGSVTIPKQASVDVAYHLSQVTSIGQSSAWNFEEPNFAGEFIRYPYFINMFSGLLYKAGTSLAVAFHLPVIALIFTVVFVTLALLRSFGLSRSLCLLVLGLTFFGSGLAYVLGYDFNAGALAVTYPQQHINYTGFVAGFFSVQRAFILGFALLLFSVLAFWRGLKTDNLTALIWAGILFGLLPLAHTHSFFVGGLLYGSALLYYIIRRNPLAFDIMRGTVFYGTFLAIIPLLAILLLPSFNLGGVPALRWGWMTNLTEIGGLNLPPQGGSVFLAWLNFLFSNFGGMLLLPIGLLFTFIARRKQLTPVVWLVGLFGLLLWLVPNVLQFQTWDYDSNKFFVYAIFFSAAATALVVQSLTSWKKSVGIGLLLAIFLFALPIPVLKLRHTLTKQPTVTMFTPAEQEASKWLAQNTSVNAVLVSSASVPNSASLLNSVAMGSGRATSVGYITWLYTHGIDYEPRLQALEKFFQTGKLDLLDNEDILENQRSAVPADYLLIDEILDKKYPSLKIALKQAKIEPVFNNSAVTIYKLK